MKLKNNYAVIYRLLIEQFVLFKQQRMVEAADDIDNL